MAWPSELWCMPARVYRKPGVSMPRLAKITQFWKIQGAAADWNEIWRFEGVYAED